jgi:ABC-type multidrug transport system fused ATPase/permease subunit
MMPDYSKAKIAIVKICELFDRVPKVNNWDVNQGAKLDSIEGDINLKSVEFSYPTREEVKVLDDFNLTIRQGQKIALVGSSGCGKSTVTQLLERFYDPDAGEVTVNNIDIRHLSLGWLRSQIGIVSQEPILFDTTIAENIAYGDNSRVVPMEEIIEAAKKANIHDFISNLPQVSS